MATPWIDQAASSCGNVRAWAKIANPSAPRSALAISTARPPYRSSFLPAHGASTPEITMLQANAPKTWLGER
jgi:hypothetical protein